jgi:hypothetical protein
LIKIAAFIADAVNDPAIPRGVKTLWLENYIEVIAKWAMGNADDAVPFIRTCLDFDYKLEVSE